MSSTRLQFPPDPSQIGRVRRDARDCAVALGADSAHCDAVSLIVDELVNNAIEHGAPYRHKGEDLSVGIGMDGRQLIVDFIDPEMPDDQVRMLANALQDASGGLPALDSERGRGLFLITVYMEELRIDVAAGGGLHRQGRLATAD